MKRLEQLKLHKSFLKDSLATARKWRIDGRAIDPDNIKLELRLVAPDTDMSNLFLWWNLIWWSLPYEHHIGRYMRFMLWDVGHDAPFGLLGLQSPPIRSPARDGYLGIHDGSITYWVNQSLHANRVGALPPYNELLGGRMVAMSLVANEVRDEYAAKYVSKTLMENRRIPSRLLFTTTTSGFGRGSMYERLRYKRRPLNKFIGYTSGSGTFHITNSQFERLLLVLQGEGVDTARGYGTGPSRKLRLINRGFRTLGLREFAFHNIQRGYYIFPNVTNLKAVIHHNARPRWNRLPFNSLVNHWRERWCIPRSLRNQNWKEFDSQVFFENARAKINRL